MSAPKYTTLTIEPRILDAQRGLVRYVASDATLDSYSEVIDPRGWQFNRFKKNAPFVNSHRYESIDQQLGTVEAFGVQGKELINDVAWALEIMDDNPLVRIGWKMTLAGRLRAVSVGFIPVHYVSKWRSTPQEMADAVRDLGLDAPTAAAACCIHLKQEQLELSACIIGANPNALAKAHADGVIADGDLAACGFDDDALQFLRDADAQIEAAESETVRRMIRGLFAQFTRTLSTSKTTPEASAARSRAAAAEATQRARGDLLTELRNINKTNTR